MNSPHISRTAAIARGAAGVALLAAAAMSLSVAKDEWLNTRVEAAAVHDLGGPSPLPWAMNGPAALCNGGCPPRALAASAVRLTLQATHESRPDLRHELLQDAKHRLTSALEAQPFSGDWWAWLAYARSLDDADPQLTVQALTRSYEAAPFLPAASLWRVRFVGAHWEQLGPVLRTRGVDEAVWMRDVDPDNAAKAFPAFSSPQAMAALDRGLERPRSPFIPHRRSGSPG